ncbi:MAG TPA: TolC family protein, partial [Woeseiaceae bacterium]|nr:TolC family protein [Woeseiaceae bacterium]
MMKAMMAIATLLGAVAQLQAQQGAPITAIQLPEQLTLEEAISVALRNNGQYLRAANDAGVLEAQSRRAFSRLLPVPGASIGTQAARSGSMGPFGSSTSSSSGTSLSLNLNMLIFDGGQTLQNYRNSKTAIQRGTLDLADAENNIRAAVVNAYYRAQLADSAIALERRLLADRKTELEVAELRFRKA